LTSLVRLPSVVGVKASSIMIVLVGRQPTTSVLARGDAAGLRPVGGPGAGTLTTRHPAVSCWERFHRRSKVAGGEALGEVRNDFAGPSAQREPVGVLVVRVSGGDLASVPEPGRAVRSPHGTAGTRGDTAAPTVG
jgi:hypothetical protein